MGIFDWIKDWVSERFGENIENVKENFELIIDNWRNIVISLFVMWLGFYVIVDYGRFSLIFYSLTAIWITFFNTLVLVKKPYYFYFTLVIILVADALKPMLADSFNFAVSGNWLMAFVYFGVWIAIRIRFNQLRNEN